MKRLFAVILVLAVIGSSWYLYTRTQKVEVAVPQGIKTEKVVRGNIKGTVDATGSLATERVQPLAASASGKVIEVLVQEGDVVKAEQVLARLDATDLQLNVKQAEAALQVSEVSLARAKKGANPEDIGAARAALESAKASLRDLQSGPASADRVQAQTALDQAKNNLWSAQASRDSTVGSPYSSASAKDAAQAQVANAELAIKVAQSNLNRLWDGPKESQIVAAGAQISQTEASLARLLSQPSAEDVALAEAQVAQGRVSVEIARNRLKDMTLKAPFAGQMVSWDLHVGDVIAPAKSLGTLVDASRYHIVVSIDELSISKVAVGQTVRITLDAFPDREFTGAVATIDVLGSNVQGIVSYNVTIELAATDLPIKPLMTAALNIVVEHKDGVLLVPNRAIKRDKQGKYVEVLFLNAPKKVYVTTGLANDLNTEVLTGLDEGQEVIVSKPRTGLVVGG